MIRWYTFIIMEQAYIIIGIGVIVFLSYFFSKFFEKTKIPDVLPLFLIGVFLGPVSGLITSQAFGTSAELFAVFTITSVLFVGGLKIDVLSLLRSFPRATLLMLLNMLGTVVIVATAAYMFFDLPLLLGTIVGILVGGTSSAVVIPIVSNLQITEDTKTMLAVESNLNVVFSVVLAYSLWRIWQGELVAYGPIISDMASTFLLSLLIGFVTAVLWSRIIPLARYLENNLFTTPAFLLIVFGTAPLLGGDGTLAVLAFGITLGNLHNLYRSDVPLFANLGHFRITYNEELFFSSLMFVFKTFFFVYMGIMTNVMDFRLILWGAGIIGLLYLWRRFAAHTLFSKKIPAFDLLIVQAMLPKGLVAGAVLVTLGAPQLEALAYPIIFMSIVGTSIAVFVVQHRMKTLVLEGNQPDPSENVPPNIHTRLLAD